MTDVMQENDELSRLADAADALANVVEVNSERLSDSARDVVERLRERRFDVAVVGEFNRGKSTLINKLLERGALPVGVLPVTSVVTELTHGDEAVTVTFADGSDEIIDLTDLGQYVTEEANPGNTRMVEGVRVSLPSTVLSHGATLIDTPGIGSIFRHSSESARDVILHADGAVMVMSADTPMTDAERNLIKLLSRRSQRTFFVLNRIDHLDADELEKVKWFVHNVLEEAFSAQQEIHPLSAKTGDGFEEFAEHLEEFLRDGVDDARVSLARRDLVSLADYIDNDMAVEESALAMSSTQLEAKVTEFRRAADWQHEAFGDDCVLFEHAGNRIRSELKERLAPLANPDQDAISRLHQAAEGIPRAELLATLDRIIDQEVKGILEPIRRNEELEAERLWSKAAERFERATSRRTDKLREIAGDLFEVDLHPIHQAQPASMPGRFFYSAPAPREAAGGRLSRLFGPLMSEGRSRDRLIRAAEERLTLELVRHGDRLNADVGQRIEDANRELERSMEDQVNQVTQAMTTAVERAQSAKSSADDSQRDQSDRAKRLKAAAVAARLAANCS